MIIKNKLIGFDADGVLYDTLNPAYEYHKIIASKYGARIVGIDEFREEKKNPNWKEFYQDLGVPEERIVELISEYDNYTPIGPKSISGVENIVKLFRNKFVLSMCGETNGLIERLNYSGLSYLFSNEELFASSGSKIKELKKISAIKNISYNNMLYVGDAISDIRDSKALGIISVAVANKYSYFTKKELEDANPDYLIRDISELEKILFRKK